MNRCLFRRNLLFILACSVVLPTLHALFQLSVTAEDSDRDQLSGLARRWNSIAASAVTAKLNCKYILLIGDLKYKSTAPNRNELNHFLDEQLLPAVKSGKSDLEISELTKTFLQPFNIKPKKRTFRGVWRDLSIISDGKTLRNDQNFGENTATDAAQRVRVRSSEEEVHYASDVKTASITIQPSNVRMFGIRNVRYLPDLMRNLDDFPLVLESLGGERKRLRLGQQQIEFDTDTGFVSHAFADMPDGSILFEVWQYLPKEFPGGSELPSVSALVHYYPPEPDGAVKVKAADVFLVKSAELNEEIEAGDFQVSIRRGTTIDNHHPEHLIRASVVPFTAPVDVADSRTARRPEKLPQQQAATGGVNRYLVMINALAVAVIACFWICRRFLRQ